MGTYPFFEVEKHPERRIAVLWMNRPEKRNSMNWPFWRDLPLVVRDLERDREVRAVVVAGRGKSFSTGLDLEEFMRDFRERIQAQSGDARTELMNLIVEMQSGLNAIADGENVYIAAVHRHCIGGGLDLAAACDLRLCSKDASFSLREAKVAIVADMGSLNRLPRIIGDGNARLLALTGRDFDAEHALRMGLVSEVLDSPEALLSTATELAAEIAANPTLAVTGTKRILNYGLNHSVEDGLRNVVLWNTAFIDTMDLREALGAFSERRRPNFK